MIATISSQDSTATLWKLRRGLLTPALLTRMSTGPIFCATRATSSFFDTSSRIASPLPAALICFSASFSVAALRPVMTT